MPKPPQPPEPRDAQPRSPAPSIDPVLTWPTPGREDLLFFVERNGDLPANKKWNFGDQYRGGGHYPDHKLVYVSPQSPEKWSRWFYASDRINQEDYNFEFTGDQLTRSYLVMRDKYYARTSAQAAAAVTEVIGEFTRPVVATADTRFAQFVYAEDALSRTETELDSLYIVVRQIYVPERLISYQWDDVLQRVIKVTRQVVPAQTETGSGTYGTQVEIQPRNIFHDFKITSEVQWLPEDLDGNGNPDYPIQIDSVAADANYQFPPLLKSVKLFGAWAIAISAAPTDYAEDFFFENDIVEPAPGPYDATVLRFITDDPETVRALYPTTRITARAETFGMIKWWASAHDKGNRAFALARDYQSPAAVHDEIELPSVINYVQGGSQADSGYGQGSATLPATPGFSVYMASTTTIAGVDTRRSKLGLWEVQVTRIEAGGATVYGDDQSSARTLVPGTGSGVLDSAPSPTSRDVLFAPQITEEYHNILQTGGEFTTRIWNRNTLTWLSNVSWITSANPIEIPSGGVAFTSAAPTEFLMTYGENTTGAQREGAVVFTDSVTMKIHIFVMIQPA